MHFSITIGTIGGTLCVIFLQANWSQLGQSFLISLIGAITSFLVSLALRRVFKKWDKRP